MSDKSNDKRVDDLSIRNKQVGEETELINRFFLIARSKLHDMADIVENGNPKDPSKYKLGKKEQGEILRITGLGLSEGILAGLATFVVLRRGPIMIGRYVMRRRQMQANKSMPPQGKDSNLGGSSYELSNPSKVADPYATNPKWPRSKSALLRGVWFCFDATISLMMGASVSSQLSSMERIQSQVSSLPLIEGESLAAKALCGEISDELKRIHSKQTPAYKRLEKQIKKGESTVGALYLGGIIEFVENCERRQAMEDRLRMEKGLSKYAAVEIPPPGVPSNGPRKNKWDDDESNAMEALGLDVSSWANDLASDQES